MGGHNRNLVKFVVGHESKLFENRTPEGHIFRWTLFVRPVPGGKLDRNVLSRVQFFLHDSYKNNVRTSKDAPYEVTETGYGSFQVNIEFLFNYPGAKPMKYMYDMVINLHSDDRKEQDVTLLLADAPSSFMELAHRYGLAVGDKKKQQKRESPSELPFLPSLKRPKMESNGSHGSPKSVSHKESPKPHPPKDKESKDRKDRDKHHEKSRVEEKDRKKERHDKADKEKSKDHKDKKDKDKNRDKKDKEHKHEKHKDKEHKHKDRDHKDKDHSRQSSSSAFSSPAPSVPSSSAQSTPRLFCAPPQRPLKTAPCKTEERKAMESDSSSPSSASTNSSLSPPTSSPRMHSLSEMRRKIMALSDEEQIYRVATILLSHPGSMLMSSKSTLSFDLDLSSADPGLIARLNNALSF